MRWVENETQTETEDGDEDRTREEDDRTEGICTLSEPSGRKPMLAEFKIQGVCLTMEIYTGAAVTLISLVTFNRHFPKMTYLLVQHDSQHILVKRFLYVVKSTLK